MKNLPLVSYIIPCFNQADFLFESIRSINLSFSGPKEIIIIEDKSTNQLTYKKIDEIKENFPSTLIYLNKENIGLSATRNFGISVSHGDFIQLLDADDILLPGKIDHQIEHFRLGNDLEISVTDYIFADETITHFKPPDRSIGTYNLSLEDFLFFWERGLSIPIHCALFKRELFDFVKFDEELRAKEDWFFWCQQAFSKKKISFINILGAIYRQHSHAMTKSKYYEMGKMWLKASTKIDELIGSNNNTFLNNSVSWYCDAYNKNNYENDEISKKLISEPFDIKEINKLWKLHKKIKFIENSLNQKLVFSVVIPVYNHYEYLHQCIESVLSQNCDCFEIICVNDNSTDLRVLDYLNSLKLHFKNVKILHNKENTGISYSVNQCVKNAAGDFLAFLDCDDYLPPNALEVMTKSILANPKVDYFFSDRIDVDENGNFIRKAIYGGYETIQPKGNIEDDLIEGMVASHLKVIKRKKFIELGGYDNNLDGVQDYDFALKMIGKGIFHYISEPLYYHRIHKMSITKSQSISQFRKMNLARRNYFTREFYKNKNPFEGVTYIKKCIISNSQFSFRKLKDYNINLIKNENLSLVKLKNGVKRGKFWILDARIEYNESLKYFIQENNSFFSLIITEDKLIVASIIGSLWDDIIFWHQNYKL